MSKVKIFKTVDRIMLDSGTTVHMTLYRNRLVESKLHNTNIQLADHSTVNSEKIGVRSARRFAEVVENSVSLSETLLFPDMTTSLLSVPALVSKNIAVLFIPGKVL